MYQILAVCNVPGDKALIRIKSWVGIGLPFKALVAAYRALISPIEALGLGPGRVYLGP